MKKQIKEVSDLTGISVRTLHYYDEIDLLSPYTTEAGYRMYAKDDLEKLQHILFFKALDFPLKKIKSILDQPDFNRLEALQYQRGILLEKQQSFSNMITTIDKTIRHAKGEINMTEKEKFEGFNFSHNPYEQEARDRYGDEAVERCNKKLGSLTTDEQEELGQSFDIIYKKLAQLRNDAPDSGEAQKAIDEWYHFLNGNFGYHYTLEAFEGLGQLYVDDQRFTKNIDKYGKGLAKFIRDAMKIYADRNK
ncbi:MerR family transcriptional regulator [Pseudalkalibacillus hwajinpoensis]|uniref:MerR family transcriptional regulator n=1 Tax=Guptibacillus hwajinpoensis TaxID=208199 RepID=UPI00325B7035